MVWQSDIDELRHRKELAEQMGGPEGVERQHSRGKLTVRERVALLADPGSFEEIGILTGSATYQDDQLTAFTPSNTLSGLCTIGGRKVVLSGGDFTVRGGAADATIGNKRGHAENLAMQWRLPYIRLLDATGGSVRTFEQLGRTYIPGRPGQSPEYELLTIVPVVSAVLGSVAGLPAVEACMAHFNLMVRDTSQVFVAGPGVVRAALGYDIVKEDLGNDTVQTNSGTIDNVAGNEQEALAMVRRFLSYLPQNVWEMAPRTEPTDDPNRREEGLLSVIPRNRRKPYNPHDILNMVLDRDSFFEIAPYYGQSRITGLARVNGYPVGVMINDPRHLGGSLDVTAGDKIIRFMLMCNTFHLPMVYFADEPGFMVGLEEEKRGIIRAGARMVLATRETRMPWITFITRQLFGVAGGCHARIGGMFRRYAWPSGNWGSMHIEGGALIAYRREIEASPDPEAKREEIELRLNAIASPFRSAEAFDIEDIIDPRDTRPLLCDFIEMAQDILKTQLGPTSGPSYRP
ncbi:MAG TPA: carboxyl transferase domain-containing protein [Dehalococcoidales bacterium]|nr:carboxyl transferase domain-containing protein [Dehalococcoidales bacterium]